MNLLPGTIANTGAETVVALANGQTVRVPIATTAADKGRAVNLGARPEDLRPTTGDDAVFHGKVALTEALGEVTLLYFEAAPETAAVVAKVPGNQSSLRGQNLGLTIDASRLHLFSDGQSMRKT